MKTPSLTPPSAHGRPKLHKDAHGAQFTYSFAEGTAIKGGNFQPADESLYTTCPSVPDQTSRWLRTFKGVAIETAAIRA